MLAVANLHTERIDYGRDAHLPVIQIRAIQDVRRIACFASKWFFFNRERAPAYFEAKLQLPAFQIFGLLRFFVVIFATILR